jgi:nitrogenase molybdenum-iron protein beta chain
MRWRSPNYWSALSGSIPASSSSPRNPAENELSGILEAFRDLAPGVDGEPLFVPDGHRARELIAKRARVGELPIIFRSTWEAAVAA